MTDKRLEPFEELFGAEPENPTPADIREWIRRYRLLVELLEDQLRQTRGFMGSSPQAVQRYLEHQNVRILEEELALLRQRLAHWRTLG